MADKDDQKAESKRILDRIAQEGDALTSFASRGARKLGDHVNATDVDQDDWAEKWGSRIGRGLGLLITIAIVGWLLVYLAGG